jgi:hypothetical protein
MKKGMVNFIKPAEPAKPKRNKSNKSSKPKPKTQKIKVEEPKIVITPSDFSLSSLVDSNGIHVITKYLDQSVNVCTLPRNLFDSWLRSSPRQRVNYVSPQTNLQDARIKQMVIRETVNIVNRIFARAR